MGAGTGCDAQYLFAEDILGQNRGHRAAPLQGLPQFRGRVRPPAAGADRRLQRVRRRRGSGAYPEEKHIVQMDSAELSLFIKRADGKS